MSLNLKLLRFLSDGEKRSRAVIFQAMRADGMPLGEACGIDFFLMQMSEQGYLWEEIKPGETGRTECFYQISTAGRGRIEELERAEQSDTASTQVVKQKALF